jgi:deoxyribodipyrimidine photo-lyase
MTPVARISRLNSHSEAPDGGFVLLWMTAQRRTRYNFALQRAVALANQLERPIVVLEALRVDYRWASDRLHRFVIEGMKSNQAAFDEAGVTYCPYVEPVAGAGSGLLEALANRACAVITDAYPCFFLRGLPEKVAPRLSVPLESVDSCGLIPLSATPRAFPTAHAFRRFLQTALVEHLQHLPDAIPLHALEVRKPPALPATITGRWPPADLDALLAGGLRTLPIDHTVGSAAVRGGEQAALERTRHFVAHNLDRYAERNHPDVDVASGLSPYLHFGHVSPAELVAAIADRYAWNPGDLTPARHGSRNGWWGLPEAVEGFLDELITWRELGFNMCAHREDYAELSSLPDWAQQTLLDHASDDRTEQYTLNELTEARTADPIWNAAQRQLVLEGRMHNYLRMLWGKKIYEWSPTPAEALHRMVELNNRFAVDGRDPNSYSGIFWVLGRYDRAWGPERPIFGKLRYMTSDSTRRKLKLKAYLDRFGAQQPLLAGSD